MASRPPRTCRTRASCVTWFTNGDFAKVFEQPQLYRTKFVRMPFVAAARAKDGLALMPLRREVRPGARDRTMPTA